jgi:pimeloyl-ACP methyl ester carboxylesterase
VTPQGVPAQAAVLTRWAFVFVAGLALCACTTPLQRAGSVARQGGLTRLPLAGTGWLHTAYARVNDGDELLTLFIDGDGSPWVHGGHLIAADPTPHTSLALELAARTPGSVLYLGRPCYFESRSDPACEPRWWTSDRYSPQIVASLAFAATRFMDAHRLRRVLLVGYSGGGTLAVLLAGRLAQVAGVISIAGNLDPDEWTRQHRYLPLSGSANPALAPALPPELPQWYLLGGRDTIVSETMAARYLARVPPDRILRYPQFDHWCCWLRAWAGVSGRVMNELGVHGIAGRP